MKEFQKEAREPSPSVLLLLLYNFPLSGLKLGKERNGNIQFLILFPLLPLPSIL
jgi:hypothetical protein